MSTDEIEAQIEIAMKLLAKMRELTAWTRREYTILFLGVFIGIGFVAFIQWIMWYIQLLMLLGLL